MLLVAVTGGTAESVALVLKNEAPPAPVGLPVIAPVEAFRFKPVGSDPAVIKKLYGAVPPVGTSKELYATPPRAVGSGQLTALSAGGVPAVIGAPGLTIVLESKVTAPVRAKALPFSVAPVLIVIDA